MVKDISRREAIHAVTAAVAASSVSAVAQAGGNADEKLIQLERGLFAVLAKSAEQSKRYKLIREAIPEDVLRPKISIKLYSDEAPHAAHTEADANKILDKREALWRNGPFGENSSQWQKHKARLDQERQVCLTNLSEKVARHEQAMIDSGMNELLEEMDAVGFQFDELIDQIEETPATTLEGFAAKLRCACHQAPKDMSPNTAILESFWRDADSLHSLIPSI